MTAPARLASLVVGAALGLSGCISLLPKAAPAQLYRFGVDSVAPAPPSAPSLQRPPSAAPPTLGAVTLPPAEAGDGILTVRGDAVAYVAGARWVSPAVDLLREAAEQALARTPAAASGVARSDVLVLEGRAFEARYAEADAAPVVRVAIRAALDRRDGRRLGAATFSVDAPAAENRVGAIVAAYDAAVADALGQAIAWSLSAPPPRP